VGLCWELHGRPLMEFFCQHPNRPGLLVQPLSSKAAGCPPGRCHPPPPTDDESWKARQFASAAVPVFPKAWPTAMYAVYHPPDRPRTPGLTAAIAIEPAFSDRRQGCPPYLDSLLQGSSPHSATTVAAVGQVTNPYNNTANRIDRE
jgi:hypothetical protein